MTSKDQITYFGEISFRNRKDRFGIKKGDRNQHMYIIGKTGTGKTTLLKNLAIQDIHNGEGIAIVDPHGEFVEEVLENIPKSRIKDVVYFNPADTEFPIGFNVLEVPDPKYKHLVASGLMGVFTKIWANVWSARMEYILNNCILALLDTPGSTLLGVNRILLDKDYRQKIVNNIQDPVVKSFWVNEYETWQDRYRSEAIAPIQNKVGQFLNVSLIRNIVGQQESTLNIPDIMNNRKILLVNVSKGRVGEDNSALLGAILITQIQLAAMERVRIDPKERKDFYLYVDEFQNFATDAFASILSEARKYRLNLVLAHQYVGQLVTDNNTKVRDAIFGNVGTLITFRVGAADAEFLEKEYAPEFSAQDLVNIPNYHIYLRLMIDGETKRPFSAKGLPPIETIAEKAGRAEIIEFSRKAYTRPREEVEEEIAQWSGVFEAKPTITLYDAICSECERKTKVPFKPEEGRPVFCEICLKKKGKGTRGFQRREAEDTGALAALGIEFSEPQKGEPPRPSGRPAGLGRAIAKAPQRIIKPSRLDSSSARQARRVPVKKAPTPKGVGVSTRGVGSPPARIAESQAKPMSLKELKKPSVKVGEKAAKGAHIEELKKVLEEALSEDKSS